MGRDRYNILLFGAYADRPAIGETDQYYIVTGSGTNKGRSYQGTGSGWTEVDLPDIPWANITSKPSSYTPEAHALDPDSGPHTGEYVHDINPDKGPHTGGLPYSHLEDVPSAFDPTNHDIDPDSGPHTGTLPWAKVSEAPSFLTSVSVHGHDKHSGMIMQRGHFGFTMDPEDDCPTGTAARHLRLHNMEIADTTVKIENAAIWFDTGPTQEISFDVRVNGVVQATIAISSTHKEEDIDPDITVSDGDKITLDAPDNVRGAKGLIFAVGLKREAN